MDMPLKRDFVYILSGAELSVRSSGQPGYELALCPRLCIIQHLDGRVDKSLRFLTDSQTPGVGGHEIMNPQFQTNEDGTVTVTTDFHGGQTWHFEKLTVARWHELFATRIPDFAFYAEDMSQDDDLHEFYRDHFVEKSWLRGPELLVFSEQIV